MNHGGDHEAVSEIVAECMRRKDAGEIVDEYQVLSQHPDYAEELREYFDTENQLELILRADSPEVNTAHSEDTLFGSAERAGKTPAQIPADLPRQFGRYRIIEKLGEGAMGTVYRAHDSQLDREIAIKTPKLKHESDREIFERFEREAHAAAGLHHRNICPVFDVGDIDGTPYLTMAFIKGRPLSDILTEAKHLSGFQAASIVRKLAAALQHAHQNGVIHRDLKPANVMIDTAGQPVIMDFGLALRHHPNSESRLTAFGALIGSPAYMSPEQVSGNPDAVTDATDIYSLGVILYELLTGKVPFTGGAAATIGQILSTEPSAVTEIRRGIDDRLATICQRMMAKNVEQRFTSMTEVANELGSYLRATGVPRTSADDVHRETDLHTNVDDGQNQQSANLKSDFPEPARGPDSDSISPWIKWGVAGVSGAALIALLSGVIIHFKGGKAELDDDSDAVVEVGADGTLTIRPAGSLRESSIQASPTLETKTSNDRRTMNSSPASESIPPPRTAHNSPPSGHTSNVDAAGKVTIYTTGGTRSLAASPDGSHVANSSHGIPANVCVWNTANGELVRQIIMPELKENAPDQLAYSPDGKWIFFASGDTCQRVNSLGDQVELCQQFSSPPSLVIFPRTTLALALYQEQDVHRKQRNTVAQRLRIWNWQDQQVLYDNVIPIELNTILGHPAVSPDEQLMTFSWGHYQVRYDLKATGSEVNIGRRSVFEKLTRLRGPLVFACDGRYAAASLKSMDYMGALLDVDSAKVVAFLDPETAKATNTGNKFRCNYAFTTDSKQLVAADHSGRVALFRIPSGETVRELEQFQPDHHTIPPTIVVTSRNCLVSAGGFSDSRITIQSLAAD